MKDRHGAILIVVLVIVMMVSLAAYHFTLAMESEHLATRNAGDQISSRNCALSGVEMIANILQQPRMDRNRLELITNAPFDLWPTESGNESSYRFVVSQSLVDESSKLNLHKLLDWDQDNPGLARESLLRLPEMDESIADRLLDWIDSDSDPRAQGDEKGSRNSVPLVVDQLGFLHHARSNPQAGGITAEDATSRRPAWLDYLTVHSAERNESVDGRRRIFVNDADLPALHRQLSRRLSYRIADYVILYRQYGPTEKKASAMDSTKGNGDEQVDFSVAASVRISNLASLIDSAVQLPSLQPNESGDSAETAPRIVPSPISLGVATADNQSIDEVLDMITTTNDARLVGRVNVLTAPVPVLAAVPGLSEALAERIVSARDSSTRSFRHPIGFLSPLSLDSTIVREVLPHLTIAGDVVAAEVTGYVHFDAPQARSAVPPNYRCEVILDASEGPTKYALFRRLRRTAMPVETKSNAAPSLTFDSRQTKRSSSL